MSCGCKNGSTSGIDENQITDDTKKEISNLSLIRRYTFRGITFLFALALLPVILPIIVWMLFKTIVLTEQINMLPLLLHVGKKLKKIGEPKEEEEEEENIEELNQDDYELIGVNNVNKN